MLVSHDRHLLRTTTDRLMLVAGGSIRDFDGDLDDYRAWLLAGDMPVGTPDDAVNSAASRRLERRAAAESRNRLAARRRPLETRLSALEAEMKSLAEECAALDAALAAPDTYTESSREQLPAMLARRGAAQARLGLAEDEWLALHAELEALAAGQVRE